MAFTSNLVIARRRGFRQRRRTRGCAEQNRCCAGVPSSANIYKVTVPIGTTGNNGCVIPAVINGGGGTISKGA